MSRQGSRDSSDLEAPKLEDEETGKEPTLAQAAPSDDRLRALRSEIRELVRERTQARDQLRRVQAELKAERQAKPTESLQPPQPAEPSETQDAPLKPEDEPSPATNSNTTSPLQAPSDSKPSASDSVSKKRPQPPSDDEDQQHTVKRPVATSNGTSTTDPTFSVEKRPRLAVDDTQIKRTRNIFGRLVGHLQKAKERLDKDKDTRQAEMQNETARRIEEKLKNEREALREAKLKTLKESEVRLRERLRRIQYELEMRETEALKTQLETHYQYMQNFISTRAQPTLFWAPHIHTDKTRELQKETVEQIEKKIKSISEQLKSVSYEDYAKAQQWQPIKVYDD